MSSIRRQVLEGVVAFSERTGISERRIGVETVGDSHLVRRLRLGHGTQLSTLERLDDLRAGAACADVRSSVTT